MLRPFSGSAGQAIVKSLPSASSSASLTGPILPWSVESKVGAVFEQDLTGASRLQPGECRERLLDGLGRRESCAT